MALPTRADVEKLIHDKLAADPDFREALLSDPRGTVSELVGIDVPDIVTVTVHEESLTDIHLVLPVARPTGELAEDDLDLVAGGACWGNCTCGV